MPKEPKSWIAPKRGVGGIEKGPVPVEEDGGERRERGRDKEAGAYRFSMGTKSR
jgi:hypothetical protein